MSLTDFVDVTLAALLGAAIGGSAWIVAEFIAHSRADEAMEQLVSRAGLEKGVISARWSLSTPSVAAAAHAEH